jgi:NAD(P)-dependent dehydrogenase (short-subunit alcohol dehydrogenase family)
LRRGGPLRVRRLRKGIPAFGGTALNNAGALGNEKKRTADFSEEDFDREVNGNLMSVWLCLRGELKQMRKQERPGGVIVNASSVKGLGAAPRAAFYSMSKAGILALIKAGAMEYAEEGIRINALVAGAFDTPMLNEAIEQAAGGDSLASRNRGLWARQSPHNSSRLDSVTRLTRAGVQHTLSLLSYSPAGAQESCDACPQYLVPY